MPSLSEISVPREILPLNRVTVLPASAVPSIKGVLSFVSDTVVVITGVLGGVESISILKIEEDIEALPILS